MSLSQVEAAGGYKVQSTVSFEQLHSTLNAIKCIHNIKESISLKTALCRIPVYHANKSNIRTFCARKTSKIITEPL